MNDPLEGDLQDDDETWDESGREALPGEPSRGMRKMRAEPSALAERESGIPSQGRLLIAPAEWRVLCAVFAAKPLATTAAVVEAMGRQRLPPTSVEALLWRLQERHLISPAPGHAWAPGEAPLQELFRPQIESFFLAYVVGVPEGIGFVQQALDELRRRETETSARVEHG